MATCFVIILSAVACSHQSSNPGYSSKGIRLQDRSHLCICGVIEWTRSGQTGLTHTEFIRRQRPSLLCLWFWLNMSCGVCKAPDDLWGEEKTEKGLKGLRWVKNAS